jgi:hypothetical protein
VIEIPAKALIYWPKNSYGKIVKTELRTLLQEPSGQLTPMNFSEP